MPKLHLTTSEGEALKFDLSLERVRIGRASGNEISSNHAELIREESGDFRLVDLESTNGTKVNGERISETVLKAGDFIQLGNIEGFYESEFAPPASAAAAPQKDPWAEDEPKAAAPTATQTASRAAVANVGDFGKHEKKKDPTAGLLITISVVAMMLCLVAAVMALAMSAGV
jgi:hypothetical protein